MIGFIWALTGALALVLIYQHLRVTWPGSYFGPLESIAFIFSRTGPRFLMFRLVPPYLIFVTVGMYMPRESTWAVALCAGLYIATTTALSVAASIREAPNAAALTRQRVIALLVIAGALAGTAWLAIFTVPIVGPFAPKPAEVAANLISAALTAVLVVSFITATRGGEPTGRMLSAEILRDIEAIAIEACVDPALATAIAKVENEQRPPWFRTLERGAHWLNPKGSYGLFQVSGHGPVSDLKSCRIALGTLAGAWPLLDQNHVALEWSVAQWGERHNPDVRFVEHVWGRYLEFCSPGVARTQAFADDGRPLVDIWSVGRFAEHLRVRGTCSSKCGPVAVHIRILGADSWTGTQAVFLSGAGSRASWWADVPAETVEIQVSWGRGRADEVLAADLRRSGVVRREFSLRDVATQG